MVNTSEECTLYGGLIGLDLYFGFSQHLMTFQVREKRKILHLIIENDLAK